MSDPRRYSISILENYSEKSLHEIALVVTQKVLAVQPEIFVLQNTENLDLGVEFLHTPEASFGWMYINDLFPIFNNFRDTCFCLAISDSECGGEHRALFFNGKSVKQPPEIRYPDFHINDFEYQASSKKELPPIVAKLKPVEVRQPIPIKSLGESMFGYASDAEKEVNEPDPVELDFIKKSLFGDIIMIDPSQPSPNVEKASVVSVNDPETREIIREILIADDVTPDSLPKQSAFTDKEISKFQGCWTCYDA